MFNAIKIRIYPTIDQQKQLGHLFGCCRWVYNYALDLITKTYKETGKSPSIFEVKKQLTQLKKEYTWLKDPSSTALQDILVINLSNAFKNFHDKRSKYPKFKSKQGRQAAPFSQGVKVYENHIYIPKIGDVAIKGLRDLPGKQKTVVISRNPDGKYYAAITLEDGLEKPEVSTNGKAIGIDLGLTDIVVTSDGNKIKNPKHFKRKKRNLKRKQQSLSRKTKGSKRREKARKLVAKVHQKISNARKDFQHKLSREMVNENQVICVEDLSVKKLLQKKERSNSISDAAWSSFVYYLEYKCEKAGKAFVKVGRYFKSTHTCSNTGKELDKMSLSTRSFKCPHCHENHDRDYNAAINIRNEGLRILSDGTADTANGEFYRSSNGSTSMKLEAYISVTQ